MRNIAAFLILIRFCSSNIAQDIASFRDRILQENLQKDIAFLCDPGLSGRKFASPGETKSADYIRKQFINDRLAGMDNNTDSYFQRYLYSYDTVLNFTIANKNATLSYVSDFFTFQFLFMHPASEEELVNAGFGLDRDEYSDYRNIDVKNKWVVVEINSPVDSFNAMMNYFDNDMPVHLSEVSAKLENAFTHGANGVIFKIDSRRYEPDVLTHIMDSRHLYRSRDDITLNLADSAFPYFYACDIMIDSIMGIQTKTLDSIVNARLKNHQSSAGIVSTKVSFKIDKAKRDFSSQNVVGIIKGIENKVGLIISAHYDAVKENDSLSYPGANDNASGTAAVLQLAQVFSEMAHSGYKPEKSIAFVLFSGEELGIVGSRYFVNHLPVQIDSSTLVVNLDCVGIEDSSKFGQGGASIAAPEEISGRYRKLLQNLALREGAQYRLDFNEYFQYSDNFPFSGSGYQAMHISTGGGELMHTPKDRPEWIDYGNLLNVTKLVFDFVFLKANFSGGK